MVAFNAYQDFAGNIGSGLHALDDGQNVLRVLLSNTTPNAAAHHVSGDASEITEANGYLTGGIHMRNRWTETDGTGSCFADDVVWTGAGGAINPFQYVILYDETAVLAPLIGWWDNTTTVNVGDGETFTVNFGTEMFTVKWDNS